MAERKMIDLRTYRGRGMRVFVTRERAQMIREEYGVERGTDVHVILPDDVMSVTATFTRTLVGDASDLTVDGPQYYVETMLDDWREYVTRATRSDPRRGPENGALLRRSLAPGPAVRRPRHALVGPSA